MTLDLKSTFDSDWTTWEMHPAGDEVVCLLSGDVTHGQDTRHKPV